MSEAAGKEMKMRVVREETEKQLKRSRGGERRWRQNAAPLWAPLKVSADSFYGSQSGQLFYQKHKAASLPVMVSIMSHIPEHLYSLKERIIGAEECKEGRVVLSRKVDALPQVLPPNKAMLLGYQ